MKKYSLDKLRDLYNRPDAQEIFERILYIWAIRHPASGYVQGINDLVTPFFLVFLEEYCADGQEVSELDVGKALTAEQVSILMCISCGSKVETEK